ncbi:hypothetical protein K3495_g3643 [Podosphaera aphanis]|nr:hypothetical protein K3495_g3643 [Podosphaera aphanis]
MSRLLGQSFHPERVKLSRATSHRLLGAFLLRKASSKAKPLVLEKPTKFNPPSHGARLRSPVSRYLGPPPSAEEIARQKVKKYPNMMPPPGSFMHWFLHNKVIHLWLSLGILSSLTIFVVVTNYKRDSPFADMFPDWSSLFLHPIQSCRSVLEIIKLDAARNSAEIAEKRKQIIDDVTKRGLYRKAHGLDQSEELGGWTAKRDLKTLDYATLVDSSDAGSNSAVEDDTTRQGIDRHTKETREKRPLKKWLGIW